MNEARRPPNITIHDSNSNDMYNNNNNNKHNNNNGITLGKVSNKDDVNYNNEYNNNNCDNNNFIQVDEIVANDCILPRRSSLLPGEVRTPSFIVTMSDWAATTSASGNCTANHSVAWSEDRTNNNNNYNNTISNRSNANSSMASQHRTSNPTPLTSFNHQEDVWSSTLQTHSIPHDIIKVKTQLQLEEMKDEAVSGTFTASHSLHSLNSSLAPSRPTFTSEKHQQQQQQNIKHVIRDNATHETTSPMSLELMYNTSTTTTNITKTNTANNDKTLITNNAERVYMQNKSMPTRGSEMNAYHSQNINSLDEFKKQELQEEWKETNDGKEEKMKKNRAEVEQHKHDHEEDNDANSVSYFTVQEGNDTSFLQDHSSNMAGGAAANIIEPNNNMNIISNNNGSNGDIALHATNSIMHGAGTVDVNGNLLHHPHAVLSGAATTGATTGLANANVYSLYPHHNSPAMMTINSNYTGANHSSVPFTYLSSAAQPGNVIHPAAMPISESDLIRHGSGVRGNLTPHSIQDLSRHSSQLAAVHASSHDSLMDLTQGQALQPQLYTVVNNNNNNNVHSTPPSTTSSSRHRQGHALPNVISTSNTSANAAMRATQTDAYMYNMPNNMSRGNNNESAMYHEGYAQYGNNMVNHEYHQHHHSLSAERAMTNNAVSWENNGANEKMKMYTTLPQQYNNGNISLYNNNSNNNNRYSSNTGGMMPMRENQANVFASPMSAADVYSQRNSLNMSQQLQLQQQNQQQYNTNNALRSMNKPVSMTNNELMQGRTNQSHPHQTYQELIEKSISEIDRFRASNFPPPPPPPPHVMAEERRIASERWYTQAENWDALQRLAPPPRNPLPEMEEEVKLQLPALTRVPYHGERWLTKCEYWFDYVQRTFSFPQTNIPVKTNINVILDHAVL